MTLALIISLPTTLSDAPTPKELYKFATAKIENDLKVRTKKEKGIRALVLQVCFIEKMKVLVEEEPEEKMKNGMKRRMEDTMSKKVVDGEQQKKRFRNESIERDDVPMEH